MAKQIRDTIVSGQQTMRSYSLDGVMSPASGVIEHSIYNLTLNNETITFALNNEFPVLVKSIQCTGDVVVTDTSNLPLASSSVADNIVFTPIVLEENAQVRVTSASDIAVRLVCQRVAIV